MNKRRITIYFRAVLCALFLILFVLGFVEKWTLLTKMMCLSCAACFAILTSTAYKEWKWVEEHGEPEEVKKTVNKIENNHETPDRSKTVKPKKIK